MKHLSCYLGDLLQLLICKMFNLTKIKEICDSAKNNEFGKNTMLACFGPNNFELKG